MYTAHLPDIDVRQRDCEIEELEREIEELDCENRVKPLEEHRLMVQRLVPQWKQDLQNLKKELLLLRNDGDTEISKTMAHERLESLLKYDEKIKNELHKMHNCDYDPKLYFEADKAVRFFVEEEQETLVLGTGSPDRARTSQLGSEPTPRNSTIGRTLPSISEGDP